jgi:nucleoside-diphosphate-sugar epimerase
MVAANADAFSHTIVRPSAVIGRGMRTRSIYALIEAIARGRFCFIGAPGAIGNYIHEENLTEALMLCATREQAKGRTYVVSQNCTIEAMVEAIRSATGSVHRLHRMPESIARIVAQIATIAPAFPLTSARVDALTSRVEYSTAAIERELGYRHRRTIEDALRELVALSKGVTA